VTGPPQHIHHGHDETFYVVDGTFEFIIVSDHVPMRRGAFLFVPRETPHTFRNAGDDLGRIVGTFNRHGSRTTSGNSPRSSTTPEARPTATSGPHSTGATTLTSTTLADRGFAEFHQHRVC